MKASCCRAALSLLVAATLVVGLQAGSSRTAQAVPRPMLAKYDKVRSRRRAETLFPLRGPSCSACDTAIPTQRRAVMAASGTIEMCEGCGALLYAGE